MIQFFFYWKYDYGKKFEGKEFVASGILDFQRIPFFQYHINYKILNSIAKIERKYFGWKQKQSFMT